MARPQMNSDPTAVDRRRSTGVSGALHPQRATARPGHDRFAVEWALLDDEIGRVDVVLPLGTTDVAAGDAYCAHCPVCENHQPMQSAATADGERYDRCLGCGHLWHVDRELGMVLGARLIAPG
jgi:hypothetical protein